MLLESVRQHLFDHLAGVDLRAVTTALQRASADSASDAGPGVFGEDDGGPA